MYKHVNTSGPILKLIGVVPFSLLFFVNLLELLEQANFSEGDKLSVINKSRFASIIKPKTLLILMRHATFYCNNFWKNTTEEMYCKQRADELTQKSGKDIQEFFFHLLKIGEVYTLSYV